MGVGGRKRIKEKAKEKVKVKEKCGCKSRDIKENPTHFKEVDGVRVI